MSHPYTKQKQKRASGLQIQNNTLVSQVPVTLPKNPILLATIVF